MVKFMLIVRDDYQVGFTIVECVVVQMVNDITIGTIHNLSVHTNIDCLIVDLFPADCVPAML